MQALLALLTLTSIGQTGPLDQPGPYMVDSQANVSFALPTTTLDGYLYWPTGFSGPAIPVIAGHGFARSADQMVGWGQHLASWGFVVVIPTFESRFLPNHENNGMRMVELLDWIRANPPTGVSVDMTESAVIGHSAGGLATFLAAANAPVTAAVGLDPVDNNALGTTAAPMIMAPTLVLGAEAAQCNANGSGATLYGALMSPGSWYIRVVGSTHCDGEDPTNGLCLATCNGEDPARRAFYKRYATAHLLAATACQGLDALPGGATFMADETAGAIADLQQIGTIGCTPGMDAGVPDMGMGGADMGAPDAGDLDGGTMDLGELDQGPAPDGGTPDAAPAKDGGPDMGGGAPDMGMSGPPDQGGAPAADMGSGAPDAGGVSQDSGGCTCYAPRGQLARTSTWLALLIGLVVLRRRR